MASGRRKRRIIFMKPGVDPAAVIAEAEPDLERVGTPQIEGARYKRRRNLAEIESSVGFAVADLDDERAEALAAGPDVELVTEDIRVKALQEPSRLLAPSPREEIELADRLEPRTRVGEPVVDSDELAELRDRARLLIEEESGSPVEAERRAEVTGWLRAVRARPVWPVTQGQRVRVAILDTGIDPSHYDLRPFGGVSYVEGVESWADDQGHGTHVAGIVASVANGRGVVGIAPRARLFSVKVLPANDDGWLSWVLHGLAWCQRNRIQVANLSLGSDVETHDRSVYNRAYEIMGKRLLEGGTLCVAAAGNSYGKPVGNPARCPHYLAVSALGSRGRIAPFSSIGPQVDLCAPGQGIRSARLGGGRPLAMSGTSMACPMVSGVAALLMAKYPGWSAKKVWARLRTSAVKNTPGNHDWTFGFGMVNAEAAVDHS